ncbi:hypothetical protein AUC61_19750 [Pseudomonas sp. S25]|uniref:Uncharacterized protein n=1 Tax=Pseudomonas maioricensis TaxID=1766623 RepID=A0ABS9ZNQ0_9PSED|nr:hypothetical protein [Pseudomonas sp. S25]
MRIASISLGTFHPIRQKTHHPDVIQSLLTNLAQAFTARQLLKKSKMTHLNPRYKGFPLLKKKIRNAAQGIFLQL